MLSPAVLLPLAFGIVLFSLFRMAAVDSTPTEAFAVRPAEFNWASERTAVESCASNSLFLLAILCFPSNPVAVLSGWLLLALLIRLGSAVVAGRKFRGDRSSLAYRVVTAVRGRVLRVLLELVILVTVAVLWRVFRSSAE